MHIVRMLNVVQLSWPFTGTKWIMVVTDLKTGARGREGMGRRGSSK